MVLNLIRLRNLMTDYGWCSKGSFSCDGDSCVCHLTPVSGKQTQFGSECALVPLRNRACCHHRYLCLSPIFKT